MDLLMAWRHVAGDHRLLVLVGPDMPGNALDVGPEARAYASAHGLGERVRFYGTTADTARLLRAADLCAQPSHYEAFSNTVIEAMATGLPVVASRVGGMLDCLVDGENGLLSAPADPVDLVRQLSRAIGDPTLQARLGERARATVMRDFEEQATFVKFEDLFADAVRVPRG